MRVRYLLVHARTVCLSHTGGAVCTRVLCCCSSHPQSPNGIVRLHGHSLGVWYGGGEGRSFLVSSMAKEQGWKNSLFRHLFSSWVFSRLTLGFSSFICHWTEKPQRSVRAIQGGGASEPKHGWQWSAMSHWFFLSLASRLGHQCLVGKTGSMSSLGQTQMLRSSCLEMFCSPSFGVGDLTGIGE